MIVAFGTGHEYLFVVSLVARANNIQSFRCKALPLLPLKRRRDLSAEHSSSMRMSVDYGGPALGQTRSCDGCFVPLGCKFRTAVKTAAAMATGRPT